MKSDYIFQFELVDIIRIVCELEAMVLVLDFSFRVLVPESKMIQAERAKFTNVSVPTLIFLDQWILL